MNPYIARAAKAIVLPTLMGISSTVPTLKGLVKNNQAVPSEAKKAEIKAPVKTYYRLASGETVSRKPQTGYIGTVRATSISQARTQKVLAA